MKLYFPLRSFATLLILAIFPLLALTQDFPPLNPSLGDYPQMYNICKKQICPTCNEDALEYLAYMNIARAKKSEVPLKWDPKMEDYAKWWAGQRYEDCKILHSFPEGKFVLGETNFWGAGQNWRPKDAVDFWTNEEKIYDYNTNTCHPTAPGQECGHYTQVVWNQTRGVGCASIICKNGDKFFTCNFYPPGNIGDQKPY